MIIPYVYMCLRVLADLLLLYTVCLYVFTCACRFAAVLHILLCPLALKVCEGKFGINFYHVSSKDELDYDVTCNKNPPLNWVKITKFPKIGPNHHTWM